jgi:hypothetical protein
VGVLGLGQVGSAEDPDKCGTMAGPVVAAYMWLTVQVALPVSATHVGVRAHVTQGGGTPPLLSV